MKGGGTKNYTQNSRKYVQYTSVLNAYANSIANVNNISNGFNSYKDICNNNRSYLAPYDQINDRISAPSLWIRTGANDQMCICSNKQNFTNSNKDLVKNCPNYNANNDNLQNYEIVGNEVIDTCPTLVNGKASYNNCCDPTNKHADNCAENPQCCNNKKCCENNIKCCPYRGWY